MNNNVTVSNTTNNNYNLGDSVGSNPGSVVGHYNDDSSQGNQYGSIVGVGNNISVKKSMMKIWTEGIQREDWRINGIFDNSAL